MELKMLHLGREGIEFLSSQLADGTTFSQCLLEQVRLAFGEVVTRLPDGISLEEAKRFEVGGKLPAPAPGEWKRGEGVTLIPVPSTRDDLMGIVQAHLSGPDSVCFLENATASRADPWIEKSPVPAAFFNDEVYHMLVGPQETAALEASLKVAQSLFSFVGALTSLGANPEAPPDRGELSIETMRRLAEQTRKIFVGAYDGEGYLIWCRGALDHPRGDVQRGLSSAACDVALSAYDDTIS
jgi:hypothetical protein